MAATAAPGQNQAGRAARDEQGNLASDPNRMDDEEYIVRLIGQVITVSLETMKVVKELPPL